MLQLCVSQQQNQTPFTFRTTGTRVYSLEEALYHVFHHWRESVDDFLSETMLAWVSELGLPYIASKLQDIATEKLFTKRLLDFLQVVEYFNHKEITGLKSDLEAWEMRREWEKLKERADALARRGEPTKALPLYKRALVFEENAPMLNNIAVTAMALGETKEAVRYLTKARTLDQNNVDIILHYIEAAILDGQLDNAKKALAKATAMAPNHSDIPFFQGLMAFEEKQYTKALQFYETALAQSPKEPHYIYNIAEVHKTMRQYQKALDALTAIKYKDATYYTKEAEIHAASGDIAGALRCMRRATTTDGANNATIWARLAAYYRQDYNLDMAENAITRALALDPENHKVLLESARIQKALGRTRSYQSQLTDILKGLKDQYRGEI